MKTRGDFMTKSEIWNRRSLIWNFAISDLKLKYRNSALGFFWTILEPLFMLGVLYVVFTNIFPSSIENFGLYLLLGIILWNTFSRGTETSLNCIKSRGSLVTQIYFPRMIPAISATLTTMMMLMFELLILFIFMIVLQFVPSITIIILPLILLLEFFLILGVSLPLSILNIKFNDIQFIWRVVLQAGFFLTPIIYKFDMLPVELQNILKFLPMAQIVDIAHNVVLYDKLPSIESIMIVVSITIIILFGGYALFKKLEQKMIEEL